jgi:hypothetical protein
MNKTILCLIALTILGCVSSYRINPKSFTPAKVRSIKHLKSTEQEIKDLDLEQMFEVFDVKFKLFPKNLNLNLH